MSKEMGLILLGILVAVLPHLGFPSEVKVIVFAVSGLVVAVIGFLLRGETLSRGIEGSESKPTAERVRIPQTHEITDTTTS